MYKIVYTLSTKRIILAMILFFLRLLHFIRIVNETMIAVPTHQH